MREHLETFLAQVEPVFQEARVPSRDEPAGLLDRIVARLLKLLTRQGYLVEEEGMSYLACIDPDNPHTSLQAASCTYRIALVPRPRLHLTRLAIQSRVKKKVV